MNTANQAIQPRSRSPLGTVAGRIRDQLFLDLLPRGPAQVTTRKPQETSLYEAFSTVWEQFEGDDHQIAVCVRILAFNFLMERTQGSIVEEWLRPSPENPETVILDDAIVAAVGSVTLGKDGYLLEDRFLSEVRSHFLRKAQDRSAAGKTIQVGNGEKQEPTPLAFMYQNIAAQLIAHQAIAAGVSVDEFASTSEICEKLRVSLSTMVGEEAFRAFFIRALALARREDAACTAIYLKEDGTLGGVCEGSTTVGVTLVGHLLNGLAVLIGETLVRRMLHEEWPEIGLSGPSRGEPQTASRAA